MERDILKEYKDIVQYIKKKDKEIELLKSKRKKLVDKVSGSNPDFPYEQRGFSVEGAEENLEEQRLIDQAIAELYDAKYEEEEKKKEITEWLKGKPAKLKLIVEYKYLDGKSWEEVGEIMNMDAHSARKYKDMFM